MAITNPYDLSRELNGISRILSVLRTGIDSDGNTPTKETVQYTLDGVITHLERIVKELDE